MVAMSARFSALSRMDAIWYRVGSSASVQRKCFVSPLAGSLLGTSGSVLHGALAVLD